MAQADVVLPSDVNLLTDSIAIDPALQPLRIDVPDAAEGDSLLDGTTVAGGSYGAG